MTRIIKSAFIILAVAAVATGATMSFFSDTENSNGNTFTAGEIDLKIDSQCSYNGDDSSECGEWSLKDLVPTADKFFDFGDIKPGDSGENTVSLHIINNDAWACLTIDNLKNDDNDCNDPEETAGDTTCGKDDGELANELYFTAWSDDGDNKWESGEPLLFSNKFGSASDILDGKTYALADSTTGAPIPGGVTQNIGIAWCFGKMEVNEDDHEISCDGSAVGNMAQTDSLSADVKFYVEQARNNPDFVCNPIECLEKTVYTATVDSNDQGTLKTGAAITDPNRTNPAKANGAPDWASGTGTNFYALGKNTSGTEGGVILKFAGVVGNGAGNDLSIHEATNGRNSYPLESAKVEVSLDGSTWYEVGAATSEPSGDGVSYFDISGTGLSTFQYVRLTDTTNYGPHINTADGFDLDAVDAVYGACESDN